jgi:hypothetical protein
MARVLDATTVSSAQTLLATSCRRGLMASMSRLVTLPARRSKLRLNEKLRMTYGSFVPVISRNNPQRRPTMRASQRGYNFQTRR